MKIIRIALLLTFLASISFAQPLKVMTYNIRYDNPGDGVNVWPQRIVKVVELIKKYDPDVIGIQEALKNQLEDLALNLDGYEYVGVGRDDGKTKGEYSAILFRKDRFSLLEKSTFWLSETPDVPGSKSWDAAITRLVTMAKLQDNKLNKLVVFVNTHYDHIGREARKESSKLIMAKVPQFSKTLPVVFTGDLNFTREEDPYRILIKPGKKFSLIDPAPEEPAGTFCSFDVGPIECKAIDYVLFTPHWEAKKYEVIKDNDGKHYPSDHLPVLVTLEFFKP